MRLFRNKIYKESFKEAKDKSDAIKFAGDVLDRVKARAEVNIYLDELMGRKDDHAIDLAINSVQSVLDTLMVEHDPGEDPVVFEKVANSPMKSSNDNRSNDVVGNLSAIDSKGEFEHGSEVKGNFGNAELNTDVLDDDTLNISLISPKSPNDKEFKTPHGNPQRNQIQLMGGVNSTPKQRHSVDFTEDGPHILNPKF